MKRWLKFALVSPLFVAAAALGPKDLASGPAIGSEAPAFDPQHVTGPDKGSHTCPMCKYGFLTGALIWVNTEDLATVAPIAARLERAITEKGAAHVRAFVIYMNPTGAPAKEVESRLAAFAREAALSQVAVAYVPGPTDGKTSALYAINPDPRVKNTVLVYRKRRVRDKFINLGSDGASLERLMTSLEKVASEPG